MTISTGSLARLVLVGLAVVQLSTALKCFLCKGWSCEEGGGYEIDCPRESSICVWYVDRTGRALKKGPGAVYRRHCGASWQGIEGCRQVTVNFDICFCSTDMCNGDEGAPILIHTTLPPTTEAPDNSTTAGSIQEEGGGFEQVDAEEQKKVDDNKV